MGRKKKLLAAVEGNLTKAEIDEREKTEKALHEFEKISGAPPAWLDKDAKAEYKRIVPLLSQLPIAALDMASVLIYCEYWSVFKRTTLLVREQGTTIIELDGQGNDKKKVNPEFTAQKDAATIIQRAAGTLGMTIDSRMKIVVPQTDDKFDPFASMMNND